MSDQVELSCPLPYSGYERVVLAHGGGGRVMHRLIRDVFCAAFGSDELDPSRDGATLDLSGPIALSTDAFTVKPLFFPGGDIGALAVTGTVNDVAMCGARPLYLTVSFVLEEGLPLVDLQRITTSMADAARAAGITIVTGDTKVVERGKGDGVFVTTTGVGVVIARTPPHPRLLHPGDAVLVSGPIGDHGAAVLAAREEFTFQEPLQSDAASIAREVLALFEADIDVHCLRDPTRGGLASSLCEIAEASPYGMRITESDIPIRPQVADFCELVGLDPLYVACEGRFLAIVAAKDEDSALAILREASGLDARRIGYVTEEPARTVVMTSSIGGERILDMLSGEQLPRIC